MTALYVLLIVAAVIALIIFIPVDVVFSVSYLEKKSDIRLTLKYFPVRIKILPQDKKDGEEKKKPDKPKEKKEKKEKEKKPLSKKIELARTVFDETKQDIVNLIHHLFMHTLMVKKFYITAKIGTGNPMFTGIAYGGANAFIYGLLAFIDHHTKLDKWNVELDTDFDSFVIDAKADLIVRTRIAYVISLGFKAALLLLKILRINRRINKNG